MANSTTPNPNVNIEDADKFGRTRLWRAAHDGDTEEVKQLLESQANIETKDVKGVTPLIAASQCGHTDTVGLLLERGANADARTINSFVSSLYIAAKNGHVNVVRLLLGAGVDTEARVVDNSTPLFIAAQSGHEQIVKLLLASGADIDRVGIYHYTPLTVAAQAGHIQVVRLLIANGANIEARGNNDITALIIAASHGHTEIVGELISSGAESLNRDASGRSTIDVSVIHGQVGTFEFLLELITDDAKKGSVAEKMLELAVENGQEDIISVIVRQVGGQVLKKKDSRGEYPLCKAISHSNFDCVKLLHSLGATAPATAVEFGKCISEGGSLDIFEYLLLSRLADQLLSAGMVKTHDLFCFGAEIDWGILKRTIELSEIDAQPNIDPASFIDTKGIGSVRLLSDEKRGRIFQTINEKVVYITKQTCRDFKINSAELMGSSAESTKVGLPDEYDYMFLCEYWEIDSANINDVGHSFRRYDTDSVIRSSRWFHEAVWERIPLVKDDIVISFPSAVTGGGTACTTVKMRLREKDKSNLVVSVDLVPALQVHDWPKDAIRETWMMDQETLKARGYQLVARPPHKDSRFGGKFQESDRERLYTVTFSKLEVEHIRNLQDEVKDAYILAKCLRNPAVSRIVVREGKGVLHFSHKYITSYMLKTIFLHNVEYFRRRKLSILDMVYRIYSQLEYCLSFGFIPLFWMPKVNLLEGLNIDVAVSHKVAVHMKSFLEQAYRDGMKKSPPDVEHSKYMPKNCIKVEFGDSPTAELLSVPFSP